VYTYNGPALAVMWQASQCLVQLEQFLINYNLANENCQLIGIRISSRKAD